MPLPNRKPTRLKDYDYSNIFVDKYVIMPNHIHLIIQFKKDTFENILPNVSFFYFFANVINFCVT